MTPVTVYIFALESRRGKIRHTAERRIPITFSRGFSTLMASRGQNTTPPLDTLTHIFVCFEKYIESYRKATNVNAGIGPNVPHPRPMLLDF